jgi:cell wall-associated NlpC family hydrolase
MSLPFGLKERWRSKFHFSTNGISLWEVNISLWFNCERKTMNRKTLKTLLAVSVTAVALSASAMAASIGGASVEATALNLRTAPSTNASVITTSPNGSVVVVGGKVDDNWYKVVYRGATGYMASEFLNFSETMIGNFGTGTIYGNYVRIREGASLDSQILTSLNNGTRLTVLGVYGGWYMVHGADVEGFVHSDYFALNGGVADNFFDTTLSPSLDETSVSGQIIVDTAMKYMGTPYVWGGTSERGFDCSGLVYYVYKECGYSINRTAASIYENGTYVEKSDLKAGDAVCFSTSSSSIGHVGIYIGDDQFIHASSGSGSVIISELSSDYYTRNYVGARRLV